MRVFVTRGFGRIQRREGIEDKSLCKVVVDAEHGMIDADLGGGLIKMRLARKGEGKSGGFRLLLGFMIGSRTVFLYAYAKSNLANVPDDEVREWRQRGALFLSLSDDELDEFVAEDELREVHCDNED